MWGSIPARKWKPMLRMKYLLLAVFVVALGSLAACGGDADKTEKTEKTDTSSSAANTTGEQASGQASAEQKPTQPVAPPAPQELSGAHILVQYQGSQRAPETVTRTKEEALALAKEIAQKAKDGQDFAELAKEYSEGPSGPRGGDLGVWVQGRMVPEFDEAILGMEIGGISDPVETAFGYHVIMRKKVEKVAARHILIMHEGSMRKPPNVTRTKEEALALAKEIAQKAKDGQDFAELAKEYSEGPSGPRGGDLGVWVQGRMVPEFDEAILGMEIGGISDPVETAFGYHVIMRKKVEKVAARHILIMHEGSMRKPPNVTRTKEEALARAQEVKKKLAAGEDFQALAKEYSDGPSAPRGGDLGPFGRGVMHPAFESAAFGLDVDGVSDVVETPFGFHLIQRYR
ncbi:hypothetical protein CSB20_09335 [bacterium DOLZORAL124_64_63]|nr:MAG: hypothetical protein CSB20_09335 [bacterium DOLZORAL124_64_63]